VLSSIHSFLQCRGRFSVHESTVPWRHLGGFLLLGGFLYGAAMGMYNARALQAIYSGTKVPLLLLVSSGICLPSFFILNTILGLRDDFVAALKGIVAAQATMAVILTALAPVTLFLYASSHDYDFAIVLNGVMFFAGALAGQVTLSRHYRPLIARNPRHRIGRISWLVLYIFVAVQMAWVLRPFIGSPGMEVSFFREGAWSNAYVVVLAKAWSFLSGI
jgi:hypothetical protein